jgi:hypothetical protein
LGNRGTVAEIAREIAVTVDRLNAGRYVGYTNIVSAERSARREQEAVKGIDDAAGVLILADNRPGVVDSERRCRVQIVVGIDDGSFDRAVRQAFETLSGAARRGVPTGQVIVVCNGPRGCPRACRRIERLLSSQNNSIPGIDPAKAGTRALLNGRERYDCGEIVRRADLQRCGRHGHNATLLRLVKSTGRVILLT